MIFTLDEMKKMQLEALEQMNMDPKETLDYIEGTTPDKSIKIGKINNIIKGIHKLANINPNMDNQEFGQLKRSILQIGQQEPILLYRNLIVDGRHRTKALKELGCEYILYQELPRNTSLNEIKEIVMSKNARRNLTKSQKAIQAYFEFIKTGEKKSDLAIKYGTDRTYIAKAETIDRKLGREKLEILLNKGKIKLDNGRYYSNLSSIIDFINKKEKAEKEVIVKEPTDEDVKELVNTAINKKMQPEQLIEAVKQFKMLIEKQLKDI